MTMIEFVNKVKAAIDDVPDLQDSKLMKIEIIAQHETEGIIISRLFSKHNGKDYETTITYKNLTDDSWKAERVAGIRGLNDEIEDLAYWTHDYAGEIDNEEEREKMATASSYLHVLKTLIKLCPDDTLGKLQL